MRREVDVEERKEFPMSYDLYCYKSQPGRTGLGDAQTAIVTEEDNEVTDPETKLKIANRN